MFTDYAVRYDPKIDTDEDLTKKILYSIILRPLQFKKPRVIGVFADSGEGKSLSVLRVEELLLDLLGLKIDDYLEVMNVCNPIEYAEKMHKLLYEKEYKKCNIIALHESRTIVKAKLWQNFMTQAVADVNAMSRSLKRLCFFVVSQFVGDITKDVRLTLNQYWKVTRPIGKNARVQIFMVWKDDRDLESPRLRKRRLQGFLVMPNGRYVRHIPKYLELKMPRAELVKRFDAMDTASKSKIIKSKLERITKEIELDQQQGNSKVDALFNWYMEHKSELMIVSKRIRNKWRTNSDFRIKHDLTNEDTRYFEERINSAFPSNLKQGQKEVDEFERGDEIEAGDEV